MRDLKFSCPTCGQHIQCEESYAGEKIPCPGCAALIRVPTDAPIAIKTPAPVPVAPPRPPAPAAAAPGVGAVPTLEENFLAESGTPVPTAPPLTERGTETRRRSRRSSCNGCPGRETALIIYSFRRCRAAAPGKRNRDAQRRAETFGKSAAGFQDTPRINKKPPLDFW